MAGHDALSMNYGIKDSEPDPNGSFRRSYPVPVTAGVLTATDVVVADPGSTGFQAVKLVKSHVTPYYMPWVMPEEYDPITDELDIVLQIQQSGTTDNPALTLAILQVVAPIAVGEKDIAKPLPATASVGVAAAALTSTTGAVTPASVSTPQEIVVRFSGKGLHPKDPITLTITPAAHTNDDVYILGITFLPKINAAQTYRPRRYLKNVKS